MMKYEIVPSLGFVCFKEFFKSNRTGEMKSTISDLCMQQLQKWSNLYFLDNNGFFLRVQMSQPLFLIYGFHIFFLLHSFFSSFALLFIRWSCRFAPFVREWGRRRRRPFDWLSLLRKIHAPGHSSWLLQLWKKCLQIWCPPCRSVRGRRKHLKKIKKWKKRKI